LRADGIDQAVMIYNLLLAYLWAGTNLEKPGKFVADGKWSATAVSSQIGIVPILKELRYGW